MVERVEDWWIGIDLGTSNSVVGLWNGLTAEILQNPDSGANTTPSVVLYKSNNVVEVGQAAARLMVKNLGNTIYDAKRLIGRSINDEEV